MSIEGKTTPDLEQLAAAVRRKVERDIAKQTRLIINLKGDLDKHGDPGRWKRYGDLLLANADSAERRGSILIVTDYFDDAAPKIEVEGHANKSVTEIAEGYFRRYAKARNGVKVIADRLAAAESSIASGEVMLKRINDAVALGDVEFLASLTAPASKPSVRPLKKKIDAAFKGARRFVSSDGIEILVGKKAADNDYLTFRIARSLDLWLHAADYPGSHVVVRAAGRKEVPHTTLVEAAELAAFYSDSRGQGKAAVRYTQKKFVNKPRKGAPGLVSLASFRTIMAVPRVPDGLVKA